MSSFWHWWVIILVLANILGMVWLIKWAEKKKPGEAAEHETTGHSWDEGTLAEYNRPMPRWWLWLFYITIVFGLVYLILYPGLGNFGGVLGWSSAAQYDREVQRIEDRLEPIFAQYTELSIPELAQNDEAMQTGRRLFGYECAVCHGVDGGGARGFPNIANDKWQWGGSPEKIVETLKQGRSGVMPPHAGRPALEGDGLDNLVAYVQHLGGREGIDEDTITAGRSAYEQAGCIACHGPDGTGNQAAGWPNLTLGQYTYGGDAETMKETILNGRSGEMPAFMERLGEDRIHVLAAYVYSLNN